MQGNREHATEALMRAMDGHAEGDAAAFAELYFALGPLVRRCHARWSGESTADDLTQQTFLCVHRDRARYGRGRPVKPWVLAIARHLSIDALRKRGRSLELLTREGALPDRGCAADVERRAVAARVRAAVEALPAGQREVVELHKLEEWSFSEVAGALGINESAARVRAHRAYYSLRDALRGLRTLPSPA